MTNPFFSRESVRVSRAREPESDLFPLRSEGSSDNTEWRGSSRDQGRFVILPRTDFQRETGEDWGESAPESRALRAGLARSTAGRIHACFTRTDNFTPSGHPRLDPLSTVRRGSGSRGHLSPWLRDSVLVEEERLSAHAEFWWRNTHRANLSERQVARLGDDGRLWTDHVSDDAWWAFCYDVSYLCSEGIKQFFLLYVFEKAVFVCAIF